MSRGIAIDLTMNGRDFGCAKSLELAELCEVTAIVDSSLRSCPRIRRCLDPPRQGRTARLGRGAGAHAKSSRSITTKGKGNRVDTRGQGV